MKKIVIKNAKIVDPQSPFHLKKISLLIENGNISQVAKSIKAPKSSKIIEGKDLHVSPGWIDLHADFCDPGFEHKEDLQSGMLAAASGGFTGIGVLPNTNPAAVSKTQIEYILNQQRDNVVDLIPIGAISETEDATLPTEIYDMHKAGARAFSNGWKAVENTGVMKRALQYVLPINAVIFSFPEDLSLSASGQINEGKVSTLMGMVGKPALSEEIAVQRDLRLLNYTNSKLHFMQLSTANALKQIVAEKRKQKGLTVAVSPWHLLYNDEACLSYDTNYKINPPLRSENDRKALIKGIQNGQIDALSAFHRPQHQDDKRLEFSFADFGMIGLQTLFPVLKKHLSNEIDNTKFVELLAINPRKILNQEEVSIQKNTTANLTVWDEKLSWIYEKKSKKSKAENTVLLGEKFDTGIVAVINGDKLRLNNY